LVEQVRPANGHRVLDLSLYGRPGHGAFPLALMLKRAYTDASVSALYDDPRLLMLAQQQAVASGLDVELRKGNALAPPFDPESFDRVVSSLLFHHMTTEEKRQALAQIFRLLRPGGELHVVDWTRPGSFLVRLAFLAVRLSDGFERTADNVSDRLVALMNEAGFAPVIEMYRELALPGTLAFYRATKRWP
jgi:ubiquinone/menaquinone biosynthesis C-methylase UbiE